MVVSVRNAQDEAPVNVGELRRLAARAVKRLRIRAAGTLAITFISARKIHTLNKQFLQHDWVTDVLSFRYDAVHPRALSLEPRACVVGDILIAPRQARVWARAHGLRYDEELARYVVHGLLHWQGHDDRTVAQQRRMRAKENQLLVACGGRNHQ